MTNYPQVGVVNSKSRDVLICWQISVNISWAVWVSYSALYSHFCQAATDTNLDSKDVAQYRPTKVWLPISVDPGGAEGATAPPRISRMGRDIYLRPPGFEPNNAVLHCINLSMGQWKLLTDLRRHSCQWTERVGTLQWSAQFISLEMGLQVQKSPDQVLSPVCSSTKFPFLTSRNLS